MKTRNDLIIEVLDLLGVTETGQEPAAEDAEKVDIGINGLLTDLARRQILYICDSNEIDDEYLTPIATILASRVAPKFGQPRDRDAERAEESKLRDIDRAHPVVNPLRTLYF